MKVREARLCFVIEHFRFVKYRQNVVAPHSHHSASCVRLTEIPLTHLKTNGSDFPSYLMVTRFDMVTTGRDKVFLVCRCPCRFCADFEENRLRGVISSIWLDHAFAVMSCVSVQWIRRLGSNSRPYGLKPLSCQCGG